MASVSGSTVSWRAMRWVPALVFGLLWWWGVLRLIFVPGAGVLEGTVVAGGWGLSVLPVHCVPKSRAPHVAGPAAGEGEAGREPGPDGRGSESGSGPRWAQAILAPERMPGRAIRERATRAEARWAGATTAWRRRRSGGGSGPS
ncbi:hypothetical protein ACFVYR_19325 [Streptomyces sp. NPDC058284]|uniref:hypothetical protein n=1 Tax=unclassified Streptomyces TaxID=2593676 RepID=UPI0036658C4A